MIVLILVITAILICVSGYFLTIRIYPRLYSSTDISGKDYIESLQQTAVRMSNIETDDPAVSRIKADTVNAISIISNSFSDNKIAVKDAVDRAKIGLALLVAATLIQTIIAIMQIIQK